MSEEITEVKTVLTVKASKELTKQLEEDKDNEAQESSIAKFLRTRGRRNNTNGGQKAGS